MEPTRAPTYPPPSSKRATRDTEPPPTPALRLDVAAGTDRGRERRGNEDSFLVASVGASVRRLAEADQMYVPASGFAALAVCDGMGGAAAGEVASQTAVEVIRDALSAGGAAHDREVFGRRVAASVEEASRRIHAVAAANPALAGMGTTATVCALRGDELYIAQVGDSRAYLLRGGHFAQLTRDQTLAALLLAQGQITPEEVESFQLGHIILQAVGTSDHLEVELTQVRVQADDVLLICSDGLYGPVPDTVLRDVLVLEASPRAAVEVLVALANEAGGPDNITAIVARIGAIGGNTS